MGYRLGIEKIKAEHLFYGTTLYGYVPNIDELESIKWLKEEGYIDDAIGFECNGEMPIIMKVSDFKTFSKLYNFDNNKWNSIMYPDSNLKDMFINDEEIQEILKMSDDDRILLTWG